MCGTGKFEGLGNTLVVPDNVYDSNALLKSDVLAQKAQIKHIAVQHDTPFPRLHPAIGRHLTLNNEGKKANMAETLERLCSRSSLSVPRRKEKAVLVKATVILHWVFDTGKSKLYLLSTESCRDCSHSSVRANTGKSKLYLPSTTWWRPLSWAEHSIGLYLEEPSCQQRSAHKHWTLHPVERSGFNSTGTGN